MVSSDRVLTRDPVRDGCRATILQVDHAIIKKAVTAELPVGTSQDLKVNQHTASANRLDPGADREPLPQTKGSLVIKMRRFDVPAVTRLRELLNRHFIS